MASTSANQNAGFSLESIKDLINPSMYVVAKPSLHFSYIDY